MRHTNLTKEAPMTDEIMNPTSQFILETGERNIVHVSIAHTGATTVVAHTLKRVARAPANPTIFLRSLR